MNRYTTLLFALLVSLGIVVSGAGAQSVRNVPSPYADLATALTAASSGDVIQFATGATTGGTVNKSVTIVGVSGTVFTSTLNITANNVIIKDVTFSATTGDGITTGTISNLSLINVVASSHAGAGRSGATLTNVSGLSITGGAFSSNGKEGLNIGNCSNVTITNTTASSNGGAVSEIGSGINLTNVTGAIVYDATASSNARHGLTIGGTSTNVIVDGGTFSSNGTATSSAMTGGGLNIWAEASGQNVSNVTFQGNITASSNLTAGIFITALTSGTITNVTVGQTGTVTLSSNGQSPGSPSGAGLILQGKINKATITASFTKGTPSAAGVIVVGDGASPATNSPTNVTITGSTFAADYTAPNPAITLTTKPTANFDFLGTVIATNNSFLSGPFITPGTGTVNSIATTRTVASGSIQVGIDAAANGDIINVTGAASGNFIVNKSVTITGGGFSAGGSMTIAADNVIVKNLSVSSISATGTPFNTVLNTVTATAGAQLGNVTCLTIDGGTFSGNSGEGLNIFSSGNVTVSGTTASNNGSGVNGSGINLNTVTTALVKNAIASSNKRHGLAIGGTLGDTKCVMVYDGTFNLNGNDGNANTGGGIDIYSDASGNNVSKVVIQGNVTCSSNKTAGIFATGLEAAKSIDMLQIGTTGTITLSGNQSSNGSNWGGGGVILQGYVKNVTITGVFTKGTNNGAGVISVGLTADMTSSANDPQNVLVMGSTFNAGYVPGVTPAFTNDLGANASPRFQADRMPYAFNNTLPYTLAVVKVKVFLEGAFSASSMVTTLATSNYVPLAQPYTGVPFSYAGTETAASTAFLQSSSIVDWILIELRSTATGAAVDRRAALLKNDGSVLETDGTVGVTFSTATSGSYFVVVKHRNHLAIMSAAAVSLPNASAYDFTTAQAQAYGTNSMAALAGGVFGLFEGDANRNGAVNAADVTSALLSLNLTGYYDGDVNFTGAVNAADVTALLSNLNKTTAVP